MKGVVMIKAPRNDRDWYARMNAHAGKSLRREFWRAHRHDLVRFIADQLDNGEIEPVANVFTICLQADCETMAVWDEEAAIEKRLVHLRMKAESLYHRMRLAQRIAENLQDDIWENDEVIESLHDRLWDLRDGDSWRHVG